MDQKKMFLLFIVVVTAAVAVRWAGGDPRLGTQVNQYASKLFF